MNNNNFIIKITILIIVLCVGFFFIGFQYNVLSPKIQAIINISGYVIILIAIMKYVMKRK